MSFFKKALASIGIGNAKIETVIKNPRLYPNQELEGFVVMQGGDSEQPIDGVNLELRTSYRQESGDSHHNHDFVLARSGIHHRFILGKKQLREIPFSLLIPGDCPVTIHTSKVWLETRLDVPNAVDPRDHDPVEILPSPEIAMVLEAMTLIGFQLREVQNSHSNRFRQDRPFLQEFEFKAYGGPFYGRFDEIELCFIPQGHYLGVMMELDRRARGLSGLFSEAIGSDERHAGFSLGAEHFAHGAHGVAGILERFISERG